jgi:hypothetical protein
MDKGLEADWMPNLAPDHQKKHGHKKSAGVTSAFCKTASCGMRFAVYF